MQRGVPRGLPFSLPSSFEPLRGSQEGEIGRGVLPMDVCIHRWIDRTRDLHRTVSHTSSRHPARCTDPSSSFSMPLVVIEIIRGRGRGTRVPRDRRGPSLLFRDGFTRSLSFVSLFMKSRGSGGERTGRTEIESPRDLGGIN